MVIKYDYNEMKIFTLYKANNPGSFRTKCLLGESLLPLLRTYPSIELSASRHKIGYQAETRGPEILVYR